MKTKKDIFLLQMAAPHEHGTTMNQVIFAAMDEYADQFSIAFAKYLHRDFEHVTDKDIDRWLIEFKESLKK